MAFVCLMVSVGEASPLDRRNTDDCGPLYTIVVDDGEMPQLTGLLT